MWIDVHVVGVSPSFPVSVRQGEAADGMEHAQPGAGLSGPGEFLQGARRVGEVGKQPGSQDSGCAPVSHGKLSNITQNADRERLASQSGGLMEHGRGGVDAENCPLRSDRGPHGCQRSPRSAAGVNSYISVRQPELVHGPVEQHIVVGMTILPAVSPRGEELPGLRQIP